MQSDFYSDSTTQFPDEWTPVNAEGSERFRFFKARIHGKLHFVKTLSESYRHDLRSIEALKKEFEIGYNIDHPNIVRYLHYGNDTLYEEYIDGTSLRKMLEEVDPRLQDRSFLVNVCRQLLEAVEYLHSKGILHLDLKPENVMITRVGETVKIIDFGCAYTPMSDTTQGFTLEYRAPEQGDGETNAYTDIYLIGRIMEELAAATANSSKWRSWVKKATAENPAGRFKSEKEAIAAIPGKKKGSRAIYIIAASLIAAIGIMAIFLPKLRPSASEAVAADDLKADTVYITTPTPTAQTTSQIAEKTTATETSAPVVSQPVATTPPKEDITRKLEKMIVDHISADYVANVKPACQSDTVYSEALYSRMQAAMKEAQKRSFEYGDNLVKSYPEQAEYIQTKVYQTISAQQSRCAVWARLV